MINITEGIVNHTYYDSINDFFVHTDLDNPPKDMHNANKSEVKEIVNEESREWRYGDEKNKKNFYEQRFNPNKGKNICQEAVNNTIADKKYKDVLKLAMTYKKRINYNDSGSRINVSKAISGEDKCFTVYKNSKKPIVKIAINICGSASVSSSAFQKVAETAIPTIYALERAGIATEVYYTSFSVGTHQTIKYTAVHVKIKSAEQRFNWTTFAPVFTLGSYRHSIFVSWFYNKLETTSGCGRPMTDDLINELNNFGYSAVIGLNAQGPVKEITSIFEKLKKI